MTRVLHHFRVDEAAIPCATSAPVELPPAAETTQLPPLPLGAPARSVGVLAELHAADRTPDPCRYDPNRLLPTSALVRQVRVDRVVIAAPQSVAELCASAGLVYAKRHATESALSTAKAGC
jgi:hypothetical protein